MSEKKPVIGSLQPDIEDILKSPEDIEDINAGRVGVYAYEYVNRNGGTSYSVSWTDIEELPY